jgi:DNA-directed RNA polymerase subunit beta'
MPTVKPPLPGGGGWPGIFCPLRQSLWSGRGGSGASWRRFSQIATSHHKTKDITGGLPRVAELFEVRKPKEVAVLSEIDGYVSISKASKKGKQRITVTPVDVGEKREYLIPRGKHINVYEGDYIRAGEPLIGGSPLPQDILNIKGEVALARYLVDEVQEVYRLQGVRINDKHIEVIVRQMMRMVKIIDPGDTDFISEEQVDKTGSRRPTGRHRKGRRPATAEPLILGITKASLSTESFISAASFQETTKVLTDAAIQARKGLPARIERERHHGPDHPPGTGVMEYRDDGNRGGLMAKHRPFPRKTLSRNA